MLQNVQPTEWLVKGKVYPVHLCVLCVLRGKDFLSLDAAFRAHLFLVFLSAEGF